MKSTLLVSLLLMCGGLASTQELTEAPMQAVIMASAWNDDSFSAETDFGFKTGLQVQLEQDRGLYWRTSYARWSLRPDQKTEALTNALIMNWYVGKKWTFYLLMVGLETYVDGPLPGTDVFTGFGLSRRIMTDDKPYAVPFHADVFFEMTFADGPEDFVGNYVQVNAGLKFGRPVK